MSSSSQNKFNKYKITYENSQYQITNLSLLISSTIYILAVVILIASFPDDSNINTGLRFRLLYIFCAAVIGVDLLFYFMDTTNKTLKYVYTTWYSIFYLISLFTLHNSILFFSIIFLLMNGILYINMHHSIYSCSCILLCTLINSIYEITTKTNLSKPTIDRYYTNALFIFITACIIILITYTLTYLRRNIINLFEEIYSKTEDNLSTMKEQIHNLKKKTRKIKKNIDSTENIVSFCSKTSTEISDISRTISKNNRILSACSKKLKQNSEYSNELIKKTDSSKDNITFFVNENIKNVSQLENQIIGTSHSLANANEKITTLKEEYDKIQTVVNNIISLSSQLNLLSLNVSIESINNDSDEAGFKVALEQLRTLTNNIHSTTEKLLDSFSDIEYFTDSIDIIFKTSQENFDENKKLIATMKEHNTSAISDLDVLSGNIANLSFKTEEANLSSNEMFEVNSELTPSITHIRSHTIENSTSIQKVYDSLKNTKPILNDILENLSDINNSFL